jgi:hypothetical protein
VIPKEPYRDLLTRIAKLRKMLWSPGVAELDGLTDALQAQLLRRRIDGNDPDAVAFAEILGETVARLEDRCELRAGAATAIGVIAAAGATQFRGTPAPWGTLVVGLLCLLIAAMAMQGVAAKREATALKRLNVALADLRRLITATRPDPKIRVSSGDEASLPAGDAESTVARSSEEPAPSGSSRKKPP